MPLEQDWEIGDGEEAFEGPDAYLDGDDELDSATEAPAEDPHLSVHHPSAIQGILQCETTCKPQISLCLIPIQPCLRCSVHRRQEVLQSAA